ncbi:putative DNA binding domain-containing protein [Candidatus Saccharibacteria bacterium]|nr:putative DNA binding domain-containing protein [Candidatus Saccharibacteria bacterium]
MDSSVSQFDSSLTMRKLTSVVEYPESLYFERKGIEGDSASPTKLANELIGMLNADGGVVVLGVSDDGVLQNMSALGQGKIEKYRQVCQDFITPTPKVKIEEVTIDDCLIFIYHVREDYESLFSRKDSNGKDNVYKRVGGSNYGPLTHEEITNLQCDKNLRRFEDQIVEGFDSSDLDRATLNEYATKISFQGTDDDLLVCRNLAKREQDGTVRYKNSAVLLFAQDPDKYVTSAYVRYVRYSGVYAGAGKSYNVVKDERFYGNIPTLIKKVRDFLYASFDDYYSLDTATGVFNRLPEYPEGAWLEGVVNAIFHRSYNLQGNSIYIKHYDNRLEISNSGPLPAQVKVSNIREQRFSRNPRIARVLFEMDFVRELNEGVKRIFQSMSSLHLPDPVYRDKDDIVTLTLINTVFGNEKHIPSEILIKMNDNMKEYSDTKRRVVLYLLQNGHGTISDIAEELKVSNRAVRNNLYNLVDDGIVKRNSDKQRDANATYAFQTNA